MATTTNLVMPIPGTNEAPKFNGHDLSDFLEDLEQHFSRASVIDEDRQVNFIARYSTEAIRKQIRFLPELDRLKTGKKWADAKAVLQDFYGDVDKPRPLSLAEFQAWVQAAADKPAFVSKNQVNKYYSDFMTRARPLLDNKQISENDMNFTFIQGAPSSMKGALRGLIPDQYRTRTSTLEVKKTLDFLRGLADKDDPTYEAWRYDQATDADTLVSPEPASLDSEAAAPQQRPSNRSSVPTAAPSGSQAAKSSAASDEMDELRKMFSEMKIMFAQHQSTQATQTQNRPQRCAMCGMPNPGHSFRACPETNKLVSEGRIRFDTASGRFVMNADGTELPRAPYNYDGGLAAYIRSQTPTPPPTHTSTSHGVGLVFANGESFSTLTTPFIATSNPALRGGKEYENRFDPKKRPGDKPSARQRTTSQRPDERPPTQQTPPPAPQDDPCPTLPHSDLPAQPQDARRSPPPGQHLQEDISRPPAQQSQNPSPPAIDIPEPPNPINRKDGWKQSQPKGKGKAVRFDEDEDVQMHDGSQPQTKAKQPAPSSGYKHVSELERQVDAKDVFSTMLKDVSVTLSLGQILGTSSTLQDLVHEATRRKRVPKDEATTTLNTHTAQVLHFDTTGVPIVQAEYTTGSAYRDYILVDDGYDLTQQQLAFSTFALSRSKGLPAIQDRLFAMATGVFTAHVNGIPFRCMIDSGSELNIGYRGFPDATRLPLDSHGELWKLKGIHGEPESLAGYVDSVPFQIGRHTFEHHIFISPYPSIGNNFDIILGQPFLTYFDARVDYSASGETVLYLWADRDKDQGRRPTLGISITDPEDIRNKTAIMTHSHGATASSHSTETLSTSRTLVAPPVRRAYIEEVEDDDPGFP